MGGVTAPVAASIVRPAWTAAVSIFIAARLADLDDFFFFGLRGLIQLIHIGRRHLLDLFERSALVVFGDGLILEQLLHRLVAIAPNIPYGDAVIFRYPVQLLDELLAPVFGQRRNGDADQLTVIGRIEAQVRRADSLFDWADLGHIPGLHRDQRRLGHVEIPELVERRRRAIVIHTHMVEDADRGAARADDGHVVLQIGDGLLHARADAGLDFLHGLER